MHSLSGALPLPYVQARVTRGALVLIGTRWRLLVVGLLSIAEALCPILWNHSLESFFGIILWNDLSDPVFDGVGLAGFKSRA